jgi:1,4-dihydroxy-2-naphthoyl-CoA hydrolase
VARPLHIGRSTSTCEIVVSDEEGRRLCTAKLTCLHRDSRPDGW